MTGALKESDISNVNTGSATKCDICVDQVGRNHGLKCASFIKASTIPDVPQTVHEAVKNKYASGETDFSNVSFSSKTVEEKGYQKLAARQGRLEELKVAVLTEQQLAGSRETASSSLASICPSVIDLELGRNLLEGLDEVSEICHGCQHLRSISLEGNRFRSFECGTEFESLSSLNLENMLLLPDELRTMMLSFPQLHQLNLATNKLSMPSYCNLPTALQDLEMGNNNITRLEDLEIMLKGCNQLRRLVLKNNQIATVFDEGPNGPKSPLLPPSVEELDLSNNAITSFPFINALPTACPSLRHLRISNNPLYNLSKRPSGKPFDETEISMLIIARLPNLVSLNFTTIKAKDRVNAEAFYLSTIAEELSVPNADKAAILASHPRYDALCVEYGAPTISSAAEAHDANTIAARLVRCSVHFAPPSDGLPTGSSPRIVEIPKSFSLYAMQAHVARTFGLVPASLRMVWETGERHPPGTGMVQGKEVEEWDSEEEEGVVERREEWVEREVELVPGTRPLGTVVNGSEMRVRVEIRDGVL
ncbi:putative cell polarity protein [Elsinoe australis]|uniref:Putative cell polarity protein n=1 Tax=Elsinoe australis TaxID=40998 RepID=A0A4U7ATK4_9PEZI|nr:putative cell polarity protein [Elsinoe australis]